MFGCFVFLARFLSVGVYLFLKVLKLGSGDVKLKEVYILRDLSEYFRLRDLLNEILLSYNVKSSLEILKKIEKGELPEHPTYEDYLEAKSLEEDLKKLKETLKKQFEELL